MIRASSYLVWLISSATLCLAQRSAAQPPVKFDGTTGPAGPISGKTISIGADRGRLIGSNLFHSFSQFDIPAGNSVTFQGPTKVENVLARVTGARASHIEGMLGCGIPGASLFLINPHGIVFGKGAELRVSGSFVATTADRLDLRGHGKFSAGNPAEDVLTTGEPTELEFGSFRPARIDVTGTTLSLPQGHSQALIGGDVRISNGRLVAPKGRIQIVSVGNASLVKIDGNQFLASDSARDDVTLTNNSRIDVSSPAGAGQIQITSRHLKIDQSTLGASNTSGNLNGGVEIGLAGDLTLSRSRIEGGTTGNGPAALVRITARTIQMSGDNTTLLSGIDTSSGIRDDSKNSLPWSSR